MRNCRRTQCQTFYHCSAFEANWKGEKAPLVSEYFMSWLQIKKIFVFKCCLLLLLHNNKESFLDRIVMIDEKWILFDNWWWPAQWLDQEAAPKHFPKPSCTPPKKKKSQSLLGGLLLVWSTTVCWIPLKPFHLRSMLSKSMQCTKNCNACSQYWSTEWAQFFSMTTSTACHTTNTSKVEPIVLWSFASSTVFIWSLTNWLPLFQLSWQLFAWKMLP